MAKVILENLVSSACLKKSILIMIYVVNNINKNDINNTCIAVNIKCDNVQPLKRSLYALVFPNNYSGTEEPSYLLGNFVSHMLYVLNQVIRCSILFYGWVNYGNQESINSDNVMNKSSSSVFVVYQHLHNFGRKILLLQLLEKADPPLWICKSCKKCFDFHSRDVLHNTCPNWSHISRY